VSRALSWAQTARAGGALLLANARYWSGVAPRARSQLARWERRARAIPDPLLAGAARAKLGEERFNAELAATLATLAPRAQRARALAAIVALQVAYDYLDTLTEQPTAARLLADPLDDGRRLHRALLDAVSPGAETRGGYYDSLAHTEDGGYLRELVDTVRGALDGLPSAGEIRDVARGVAERCAEAQVLAHAAALGGDAELQRWARSRAAGQQLGGERATLAENPLGEQRTALAANQPGETGTALAGNLSGGERTLLAGEQRAVLEWPEFLAGAQASVLSLHALIAAAADERTSTDDAERIDALYLSIAVLTMLDSLIDSEQDAASGEPGYARHYDSPEQLAMRLGQLARDAARQTRDVPHAGHHAMTLVGVVAFYASAPAASDPLARPAITRLRGELRPLMAPTLLVMRSWRLAKTIRARARAERMRRFRRY
jgi:tetraprenyl-beta-curcumene synthase